MSHHALRGALARAALVAATLLPLAACSGDDGQARAAYCSAWDDVAVAFKRVDQIDVVQGGLGSIKEYLASLGSSLDALGSAAQDQLGSEVAKVRDAATTLADTVTSPDLPVDRRAEVRAARDELSKAWDDLVAKAKVDCPSTAVTS